MQEDLRTGLKSVLSDTPVRQGYFEALAGASTLSGPFARAELGYHPSQNLGVFAYGQWTPSESSAGAGLRIQF